MSIASRGEIRVETDYACPHCRTPIRPAETAWRGWQACPACGTPSLPPPPRVVAPDRSLAGAGARAEAWIASGDTPDESWPRWSRASTPLPGPRRRLSATERMARKALGVGLVASAFGVLVGLLDANLRIAAAGVIGMVGCHWLGNRVGNPRG